MHASKIPAILAPVASPEAHPMEFAHTPDHKPAPQKPRHLL